jgi:hypothetical protein
MATSPVFFKNYGFAANDLLLFRVIVLLNERYRLRMDSLDPKVQEHAAWMERCIQESAPGCVYFGFDEYINDENRDVLISLLQNCLEDIERQGEVLPGTWFNEKLHLKGITFYDIPKNTLREVIFKLVFLLKEEPHPDFYHR